MKKAFVPRGFQRPGLFVAAPDLGLPVLVNAGQVPCLWRRKPPIRHGQGQDQRS